MNTAIKLALIVANICVAASLPLHDAQADPIAPIQGVWVNQDGTYGPLEDVKPVLQIEITDPNLLGDLIGFSVNGTAPPGYRLIPGEQPDFPIFKTKLPAFSPVTLQPTGSFFGDDPVWLVFDSFASFRTLSPAPPPTAPGVQPQSNGFFDVFVEIEPFRWRVVPAPTPLLLMAVGFFAYTARPLRKARALL